MNIFRQILSLCIVLLFSLLNGTTFTSDNPNFSVTVFEGSTGARP